MIIKVCGLTHNKESAAVAALQDVDMLGFIFYEKSPRFTESTLATDKEKVGVFVNAPLAYIQNQVENHHLTAVQLHGSESPEYIKQLPGNIKIIKAFGIATAEDLNAVESYNNLVDYFLFDTKSKQHGGTGIAFNWQVLDGYTGNTPFLLSGGIGPHSAEDLKNFRHQMLAGYDLNSKFETAPKVKDEALITQFLNELKS